MYQQTITHNHRTAIIILVDCSTSMLLPTRMPSMTTTKAKAVAFICNYMIDELIERATRRSKVHNYYDVAVLGYASQNVRSMLATGNNDFIAIDRLAEMRPKPKTTFLFQERPDGMETSAPFTIHEWITPTAGGSTPMYEALTYVYELIDKWCKNPDNRDSFPPIIFHITDGKCNDAEIDDLVDIAQKITATGTNDGNTLMYNIHLSSDITQKYGEIFPSDETFTTNDNGKLTLFKISSLLPASLEPFIAELLHLKNKGPYRGVAFNASLCDLISIMNIGSESINSIHYL